VGVQKQEMELFSETLHLAFTDQGEGRAFLILHGGAGPASVSGLGGALAKNARSIVPTHPGFDGEPRPDRFARIDDLVLAYLALIERLNLKSVVVVGNSVGGWIAAEMALRKSPRLAGIVLLNAVGIDTGLAERSIVDPMKLAPAERSALAFHAPARFAVAPSGPAAVAMANNQQTLRVYAGEPFMHEPTLRSRLAQISIPAMIAWGESDRIVDVDYGRRYASSIPGARFELIPEAAHFPQIERLDEVVRLISDFTAGL
jgi:pimeloyl-ACP methyl ester carboxylesterase